MSFPIFAEYSPHDGRDHSHDDLEDSFEEVYDDLAFLTECSQKRTKDQAKENYAQSVCAASVLHNSHQFLVSQDCRRQLVGDILEGLLFRNVHRVRLCNEQCRYLISNQFHFDMS